MSKIHTMREVKEKHEKEAANTNELIVIEKSIKVLADEIRVLKVTSKETFVLAADYLDKILRKTNKIKEYWKSSIEQARETKRQASVTLKDLNDKESESLFFLTQMEKYLKQQRQDFKALQDEIDRKEKEKLEEIERKKAQKEQEKLLKKAEREKCPEAKEELKEKAEEIAAIPVFAPKTIVKSERTESGTLNTWVDEIEIEIDDIKKICAGVAAGLLPVNCVTVSEAKIKAWAKANAKRAGNYEGFKVMRFQKERITLDRRK